ncbi:MAG: hypothetical protein JOZ77_02230 [Candidatus Eremiobacteraeota bacterium]|nr:hypothetical protein [Candidatus Eremiobacteraeota bacterium]
MRTIPAGFVLALAASLLGSCAGGGLGGSPLPTTSASSIHRLDSVGGGPPVKGPMARHRSHSLDSVGGGPPIKS